MAAVRTWLLGVVLTAFACGAAAALVPAGRHRAWLRFVGGLLILLAAVQPLRTAQRFSPAFSFGDLESEIQEREEDGLRQRQKELAALIEERCAAYIWDKASQLGLEVTVSVETALSSSGIPLPEKVTVAGPYSSELAQWLRDELGIAEHQQIWLEGIECIGK